jgi:hypothetical protein
MELRIAETEGHPFAELVADGVVIETARDGLDLIGNASYQGVDHLLLYAESLAPDFFDLGTGLAGEILQKAANYRVRLTIVGAFDRVESESLRAFIVEANRGRQVAFVADRDAALATIAG